VGPLGSVPDLENLLSSAAHGGSSSGATGDLDEAHRPGDAECWLASRRAARPLQRLP
jgi:hypothetical protein